MVAGAERSGDEGAAVATRWDVRVEEVVEAVRDLRAGLFGRLQSLDLEIDVLHEGVGGETAQFLGGYCQLGLGDEGGMKTAEGYMRG